MSDSTTVLDQVVASAAAEASVNESFDAAAPSMIYGRRASTCTGTPSIVPVHVRSPLEFSVTLVTISVRSLSKSPTVTGTAAMVISKAGLVAQAQVAGREAGSAVGSDCEFED